MNIGFDLDKVFIDTPPFIPKSFIDKLYKKRDNGVLLYRIPGPIGQVVRKITHLYIFRPQIKENIDFLHVFPKDKNNLYLISGRFKFLENKTKKIIEKYHFTEIFDDMYFNFANEQPHFFKNRIIKKLKLDCFIDDDLSLLNYIARNNPKIKFFWLTNHSGKAPRLPNIHAISKLPETLNQSIA
ncbi:hypothetical protein KJ980_02820 [Patescibacteria group bacterium]|nr:hypothetical protein [Patescibacteria group bacterium]